MSTKKNHGRTPVRQSDAKDGNFEVIGNVYEHPDLLPQRDGTQKED